MSTTVRRGHMSPPVLEPSTDFPTAEDETPGQRSRLWIAALVGLGALVAGGAIGFAVGRAAAP